MDEKESKPSESQCEVKNAEVAPPPYTELPQGAPQQYGYQPHPSFQSYPPGQPYPSQPYPPQQQQQQSYAGHVFVMQQPPPTQPVTVTPVRLWECPQPCVMPSVMLVVVVVGRGLPLVYSGVCKWKF